MHVGIGLLTLLPGQVGGSETLVRGLLKGLADDPEQETNSQSYAVFTNAEGARTLEPYDRSPVHIASMPGYRPGKGSAGRLLAMVRARYAGGTLARAVLAATGKPFDVVHYALTVPIPPLDCPKVVTVYDVQHEVMPEFFSPGERAYRGIFYGGAIANADVVMTISEYSKRTILERHAIEPERVVVSQQGIDRERFSPVQNESDARIASLDLPERFVLYPSNLWPHKNHERLFDALPLLEDPDLGLVLTGERYDRWGPLAAKIDTLGLVNRVRHLGYVERELLPALYRNAVGTVFPSLFEGLGIPPLEALSCGCAVAAARVAALPEVLEDNAIWFDPTDPHAIAAAIDSLATENRPPAEPGPDFWGRFTWEENARIHRAAYRLAKKPGG